MVCLGDAGVRALFAESIRALTVDEATMKASRIRGISTPSSRTFLARRTWYPPSTKASSRLASSLGLAVVACVTGAHRTSSQVQK